MLSLPSRLLASLLIFSVIAVQLPPALHAQMPPPNPQQLDQLLAPIALYPDSLLAQITSASTNPQEILDVDNWLANNSYLSGGQLTGAAQQQGFDPAFLALVNFPNVLQMMADNIDDYAAIGQAMMANQAAVSQSIQRLRAQAYAAGALQNNPQQTVLVQQSGGQPVYVIQPANPQMVYVPQYDPTMVYVRPSTGAYVTASLITFGIGIGIGALIASRQPWGWGGWGWNWGHGVYYNHGPWMGWHGGYRPPNVWYRPRPIVWTSRPGYGGNWHYRPPNYRPPSPVNRPSMVRPGPGNRPVFSHGAPPNRPGMTNGAQPRAPYQRPGTVPQPGHVTPGRQPNQPNTPANTRPYQRPGAVPQPGHVPPGRQPNQPAQGNPQQQHRPQQKPNPQRPQHKPEDHERDHDRPDHQ